MLRWALAAGRAVGKLLAATANAAWEPIRMMQANRKIMKDGVADTGISALSLANLKSLVESEWTRAKELDDKLQKLTASLSIAVAVSTAAGSASVQDIASRPLRYSIAGIFALGCLMFLGGALIGFSGLRPKARWGYGAAFMNKASAGGGGTRKVYRDAAIGFERDNMIRANQASGATACVRNGVVLFGLGMLAALAITTARNPSPVPPPRPVAIEIRADLHTGASADGTMQAATGLIPPSVDRAAAEPSHGGGSDAQRHCRRSRGSPPEKGPDCPR